MLVAGVVIGGIVGTSRILRDSLRPRPVEVVRVLDLADAVDLCSRSQYIAEQIARFPALLDELLDWSTQDRFTYQHVWQKGDMVIFNNPGLLHRSRPYNKASGRVLHRATVKGVEAITA